MRSFFLRAHAPMLLILLLATGLRWHQLAYKSLWVDEIGQVVLAQGGLWNAIVAPRMHVGAPPLDYVLAWLAIQLGMQEFILRFMPAAWSILTIALTYSLARRVTRSSHTATLAALLLALSASAVQYAQEVRFYALGTFLFTASIYLFVRAYESPTVRNWFVFTIVLTLAFYAHYYALILAGLLVGFMLIISVSGLARKNLRAQWRGLVISLGAFAVLAAPWLLYAGRGAESARAFDLPTLGDLVLRSVFGAPNSPSMPSWLLGVIFLCAAGVGLLSMWRARAVWSILFFLLLGGGIAAVIAANYVADNPFAPRQLLFFAPCYFSLTAIGLVYLWERLKHQPILRVAGALAILLLAGWVWGSALRAYYNVPKDNWRSAAFVIARNIQPNDAIFFTQPTLPTYLNYYAPSLAQFSQNTTEANDARRIWIVGWGARSRAQAQNLIPQTWHAIALNADNDLQVLYAGDVSEVALWNEASLFELTPQVLAYSEALKQRANLEEPARTILAARARDAVDNPAALLLDSEREMLRAKLALDAQ